MKEEIIDIIESGNHFTKKICPVILKQKKLKISGILRKKN
jgi:hypothetical protein